MSKIDKTPSLKQPSGNPYSNIGDSDEIVPGGIAPKGHLETTPVTGVSVNRITVMERWTQPSGNPYGGAGDPDEEDALPVAVPARTAGLSKAEFIARCRRIFRQYMPALETKGLRTHHRDFITRNLSGPATRRARLAQHLEKYDLSEIVGIDPQFNREKDPFAEAKLREIERLADTAS